MKRIAFLMCLVGIGANLMAAVPFFDGGATRWRICLPVAADVTEQYAAEELQTALRKISGAEFPIERRDDAPECGIILGSLATSPSVRERAKALRLEPGITEELAVRTEGGRLFLAGNMPRGTLYAVYVFLRDELGVRWFWPGEDGEFITPRSTWTLPEIDVRHRPSFRFRTMDLCHWHHHVPTEIWLARNLLNCGSNTHSVRDRAGFYRQGGGHYVTLKPKDYETHPEYFSLINGQRAREGLAGCWSNPGFLKLMIERHVAAVRKGRYDMWTVFPADITQRCECPRCRENPDASSRWFDFYAKLIEGIRKELPHLRYAGIAYQEYRKVPARPVRHLEYVKYCQYNRCYVHRLDDPSCKLNRASMAELRSWMEKAPMGIYGYEFDIFKGTYYLPIWHMLDEEIKAFRDLGMVYMKTEMACYHSPKLPRHETIQLAHRIPNYLYARLLWDADADVEALLRDWCEKVYGAGADSLYAYHAAMARAWDEMKIHLTYFGNLAEGTSQHLLSDSLVALARKQFKAAREAVAKSGSGQGAKRSLREIDLEEKLFQKWERTYERARASQAVVTLPKLKGPQEFDRLGRFLMTSRKNTHQATEVRLYWTDEALMVRVDAEEADMQGIQLGRKGRDRDLWHDENVEIFLDPGDGNAYRHFAANLGGGTYDAMGNKSDWSPAWSATPMLRKDGWSMSVTLPFSSLGIKPSPGDQWRLVVLRNSEPEACGFPRVSYHDPSCGALLVFSENSCPDLRMTWIASPRKKNANGFERSHKGAFIAAGWQVAACLGNRQAMTQDLASSRLIAIETYQNDLSDAFFREKLLPAVRRGAVVLFESYFHLGRLHQQLESDTFRIGCVENCTQIRKPTWLHPGPFSKVPHDLKTVLWHTPSCNFQPAHPECWTELARQATSEGRDMPFILAQPLGKGMVIVTGDIMANGPRLFENLLRYALDARKDGR